ncbi:MAG: ATP-binding protein [Nibricoccus sp.]
MLRTRLYLGLLPLLLLFIGVGLATVFIAREVARSMEQRLADSYRWMIGCYEMSEEARAMVQAIHDGQNGRVLESRDAYYLHRGTFQKALMEQSFSSAGSTRADSVSKVVESFDHLSELGEQVYSRSAPASMRSYTEAETALFRTLRALKEITEFDYAELRSATNRAAHVVKTGINILLASLVGGILLSLFLSYRLARSILRPVQALTASAAALGDGDWDKEVPVTSRDELGELARTFNGMASKLRAYRDATTAKVVRAQRTMEATLTSTPDPLFVIGKDGTHEVKNPAAEALAATAEFSDGLPPKLASKLQEVLATGNHYLPASYDQVVTVHLDREERHFLPRILAIGDALTGFGGAALILQDVTKFRLLDDAKSNLVGTVSHELKTPLTSLRMAVYLLLEQQVGALSAPQRDLLETARDDADRLLRILNDLLDLARLEAGVAPLNKREVEVEPMLAEMAREMRPIVEANEQEIVIKVESGVPRVNVDADRLRHVFINLLANASKYSPPQTEITLYAKPAEEGFVRFGVRDQGPGIPAENVPHVFEKFYRVPGQTRKGAGLGLTISREIVTAHGGSIACASKLGEGTDFYFLLPIGS